MASGDLRQSISGTLIQEIVPANQQENVSSLLIANTHDSDAITVTLFAVSPNGNRFTIIKALVIPFGISVFLKEEIPPISIGMSMQIQLAGSSPTADIFITNE